RLSSLPSGPWVVGRLIAVSIPNPTSGGSMEKGSWVEKAGPWYRGVTRSQWLVLAIASAGWVFDVFEGQIFVSLKDPMLAALEPGICHAFLFNSSLAAVLMGGASGGVVFARLCAPRA